MLISYWIGPETVNPGVWITTFLVVIVGSNYWNARYLSEYEFCLSHFRIMIMLGLMVLSFVLALGIGPNHDQGGFRYWRAPGAFNVNTTDKVLGYFYAICRTMPAATFAYLGSELIGMAIVQTQSPRRTSRAIRLTFRRIFVFNVVSVILLGMIIPYDSELLAFARKARISAAASAFVVAIELASIRVLPSILNGCILLFVLSASNYGLCMATKALYLLAVEKQAPRFLSRLDRRGVPIYSLGMCSLLSTSAYMNIFKESRVLFGHLVQLVSMFGLLAWITILITHIAFVQARKAQKIPDKALAFRAPFGAFGSVVTLVCCIFIGSMRWFDLFHRSSEGEKGFDYKTFVTSYIGVPLYLILILGYKLITKSGGIEFVQVDLWAERAEFERSGRNAMVLIVEDNQSRRGGWKDRLIKAWML